MSGNIRVTPGELVQQLVNIALRVGMCIPAIEQVCRYPGRDRPTDCEPNPRIIEHNRIEWEKEAPQSTGDYGASSFNGVIVMYIQVTIDLQNYTGEVFDLQISNYLSVKKVIEIVWQVKKIEMQPKDGYWIRVQNKEFVRPGYDTLLDVITAIQK